MVVVDVVKVERQAKKIQISFRVILTRDNRNLEL